MQALQLSLIDMGQHLKALGQEGTLLQLLPVSSLHVGVELEAAQAQEGPEGGKQVRRGNAKFKGQEGGMA